MKIRKMLFYGMVLTFMLLLVTFGENANANVLVQGSELSDAEYADLLASIPEGNELVPNDEYDALVNQRASSGLYHNSHVQSYGWLGVKNATSHFVGIPGRSLRLEALKLATANLNTNIFYRVHIQSIGWQSWKSNGEVAGTTSRGLRLEAIQIVTAGTYGVSYRAYVQSYGWCPWISTGQSELFGYYAGTSGQAKRLEAIDMKLYRQTL